MRALTRVFRIRDKGAADPAGRPSQFVLIAAGLAFAVNVASWGGHVPLGELLVTAGVVSALIDFVMWMAVATLGVLLGDRARPSQSWAGTVGVRDAMEECR